jgi:maleate isomerase
VDAQLIQKLQSQPVLDDHIAPRRIGLVLLSTDLTTERDFSRIVPQNNIATGTSRVEYQNPTTPENLRRMMPKLSDAVSLIVEGEPLDAVYYSCTSASAVLGYDAVVQAIHAAKPGARVITPTSAAADALRALGASRISILTPYVVETTAAVVDFFAGAGFDIANVACLGMEDDREMARLSRDAIYDLACQTAAPDAQALFISCTALRSAEVAERIEKTIGKPVVTSNQAAAWAMMRAVGTNDEVSGFGQLLHVPGGAG